MRLAVISKMDNGLFRSPTPYHTSGENALSARIARAQGGGRQTLLPQSRFTFDRYAERDQGGCPLGGLLKKSREGVVGPRLRLFTVIPAKAGIHFTPFAFRQGSCASAGKETPPFIHPHPQMDSGFRRNDEQNQIRRGYREENAANCRDRPLRRWPEALTRSFQRR